MTTEDQLAKLVGREVVLCDPHPASNFVGKITGAEHTPAGWMLTVELTDGRSVGVFKREHLKYLGQKQ